jgi:hypothetical protein
MGLTIQKSTAKKIYPEAPVWFQEILVENFGKETFAKRGFEDIKTLEDAAEETGHTKGYLKISDEESTDEWAYRMLKMVVKAINQGWTPDWSNNNQQKWWPWFNLSSGFGFSYSGYLYGSTGAAVGSRLCFETEAKSNFAAKQFIEIYEQFLTIKK